MQRTTATRRLVKSPPELWAELSSEESLSRHLAPFGEIHITRVSPETTVAWEGDRVSGTVKLEATGWGTKVSLTATPTAAELVAQRPAPTAPSPEPARAEPAATAPAPAARAERSAAEPEPGPEPAPEKRPGFFARLFRRRRAAPRPAAGIPGPPVPVPDPSPPAPGPDPGPPAPGPDPTPPAPGPAPTPPPQIHEQPPAQTALDPSQTVAILTEVLDDLGAAHHRPFSRD